MGIFSSGKKTRWDQKVDQFLEKGNGVFTSESDWPSYENEQKPGLPAKPHVAKIKVQYGIDQVIELMRTLPTSEQHLVTDVVLQTLKSAEIDVKDILESAAAKLKRLDDRCQSLRDKIAQLEKEIKTHQQEISLTEADRAETAATKARIEERTQAPETPVVGIGLASTRAAS